MHESISIGAFEAKTKFSELLNRVSGGAEITITRHERPVARLVPFETPEGNTWGALFAEMEEFAASHPLNPPGMSRISYRELIEEGRRV